MAGEWRTVAAEEFCASVRDGTHDSPKPVEHGRSLVTSRHITGGRLDLGNAYLISQEDFDAINKRSKVDRWDVLISMIGTVGEPCLIRDDPHFAIKNIGLFKSKGEVEGKWLYYYLRTADAQQLIHEQARGTTQQYIPLGALREFPIPVPGDPEEMRAIAHILGTLDDKIELNRRMNQTLEAMARALFKSWFVDFDPVRAKAEGRDPCLPQPLADLFPDSFAESDVGEIPKGWQVKSLPDLFMVNPARPLRNGDVAPYLDMANMPTKGHAPDDVIYRAFGSGMRFLNGDTLVARITPCLENGKTAYVDFLKDDQVGWGSTEYIVMRPKSLPTEFAYCLARSEEFRYFAIQSMTGSSGRQRVPAESLSHFHVVEPTNSVADVFGRFAKQIFARVRAATTASAALCGVRDALLPKLVSGSLKLGVSGN